MKNLLASGLILACALLPLLMVAQVHKGGGVEMKAEITIEHAIEAFNRSNSEAFKEFRQNPISRKEVLSSISLVATFFSGNVNERERLDAFANKILNTERLPENAKIKLLTGIINSNGKHIKKCFTVYLEFDQDKQSGPYDNGRPRIVLRHLAISD